MTAPEPRDSATHPTAPTPTRSAVLGAAEGQETAAGDVSEMGRVCPHGDPTCPCQDGDPCHYEDLPGSPSWPSPSGRVQAAGPSLTAARLAEAMALTNGWDRFAAMPSQDQTTYLRWAVRIVHHLNAPASTQPQGAK